MIEHQSKRGPFEAGAPIAGPDLTIVAPHIEAGTLTASAGGNIALATATATYELKETRDFKSNRLNIAEVTAPLRGRNGVQNSLGFITPKSEGSGGPIKDNVKEERSIASRTATLAED